MPKSELEGHLAGLHVKEQEEIIAQSEELCTTILKIVKSDVLSVETEHFTDSTFGSRSTVSVSHGECEKHTVVVACTHLLSAVVSVTACLDVTLNNLKYLLFAAYATQVGLMLKGLVVDNMLIGKFLSCYVS